MSNENLRNRREQHYGITVYDRGEIEEFGGLNNLHSKLEGLCREIAKHFKDKYKGRFEIKIIIR